MVTDIKAEKTIPYGKGPKKDKYFVKNRHGIWHIYRYDDDEGNYDGLKTYGGAFRKLEWATQEAALMNDWQVVNTVGFEVYRGDKTFSRAFDMKPWEHVMIYDDKLYFFVWDTRELTKVAKKPKVNVMTYLSRANDNGKPICKDGKWLYMSELRKQPVNFKTAKQQHEEAGMECDGGDMSLMNSDNTGLAPDVDVVGSGDTQTGLVAAKILPLNYTDGTSRYSLIQRNRRFELYDENGKFVADNSFKSKLIKKYDLTELL